jgi:hypothetical protein
MIGEFWIWLIIFGVLVFIILGVTIFFKRKSETLPLGSFTLDATVNDTQFDLWVSGFGGIVEYTVDWGDGTIENVVGGPILNTISHTYSSTGNYTIKFTNVKNFAVIHNYDPSQPLPISITNKITNADFSGMIGQLLYKIEIYDGLLTTLDITGLDSLVGLNLAKNTLSVNSVNTILSTFNSFNTTFIPPADFGTINVSQQNPSAPPSSGPPDGITAKSDLESRGWTVIVD